MLSGSNAGTGHNVSAEAMGVEGSEMNILEFLNENNIDFSRTSSPLMEENYLENGGNNFNDGRQEEDMAKHNTVNCR